MKDWKMFFWWDRYLKIWSIAGIFLLLGIVLTMLHWRFRHYIVDDAYIHLRIARNYVTCGRPYYNCTAPVISSSSAFWTLLLYLGVYFPGSDAFKLALLCGFSLSGLITIFYLLVSAQLRKSSVFIVATTTAIVSAPVVAVSLQQMETNLAILLLFMGILAYGRGLSGLGLFLLGMSGCTRFELFIPWGLFCILTFKSVGVRSFVAIGISLIPALFIFAGMFYYTGSILPHSIVAKEIVYQVMPAEFFNVLKDNIAGTPKYAFGIFPQIAMGFLGIVLIAECVRVLINRRLDTVNLIPLAVGISGYVIGLLYLFKHVLLFPWYLPLIFTPLVFWAFSDGFTLASVHKVIGAAVISIPFLKAALFSMLAVWLPWEYPDLMRSARARQYLRVGEGLRQSCPTCTVMAPEIGAIGYAFKGKIIDACGLISPEALKYHPVPVPEGRLSSADGAVPHGLVEEFEPEVIVSLDRFMRDLRDTEIVKKYLVFTISPFLDDDLKYIPGGHIWGSRHLLILLHREKVNEQIYERLLGFLPELRLYRTSAE